MSWTMYDDRKMQELIIYIANRQADDPTFGKVKLAKLLFYSDFEAFARLGTPITGATYQKLPQGPAAREYLPAESRLFREHSILEEVVQVGDYSQYRITPLREPDTSVFSDEERQVIDGVLALHKGMSGTAISEKSHQEVGWQVAAMQETIPYSTYFVAKKTPSAALLDAARSVVADHGWLSAASI